jgi:hypothetical protein
VVPVIDVLFQGDDLNAGNGLELVQPRQEGVRRRATGATFRGEQFNQHGFHHRRLLGNARHGDRQNHDSGPFHGSRRGRERIHEFTASDGDGQLRLGNRGA